MGCKSLSRFLQTYASFFAYLLHFQKGLLAGDKPGARYVQYISVRLCRLLLATIQDRDGIGQRIWRHVQLLRTQRRVILRQRVPAERPDPYRVESPGRCRHVGQVHWRNLPLHVIHRSVAPAAYLVLSNTPALGHLL